MLKLLIDLFEDVFFATAEKNIMRCDIWLSRKIANVLLAFLTVPDFIGVLFAFQI